MTRNSLSIVIGAAGGIAFLASILILASADSAQRHISGPSVPPAVRTALLVGVTVSANSDAPGRPPSRREDNAAGVDDSAETDIDRVPPSLPLPRSAPGQAGNADRGRSLFFQNAQVNCSKCHAIRGQGGAIGPDLSEIGAKRTRAELLASIQNPDQVIAQGFHTLMVQTVDGLTLYGVVREDTPLQVRLVDVEGREHVVPAGDVEERRPGRSAMPADISQYLTPQQLDDLVELLSTCR